MFFVRNRFNMKGKFFGELNLFSLRNQPRVDAAFKFDLRDFKSHYKCHGKHGTVGPTLQEAATWHKKSLRREANKNGDNNVKENSRPGVMKAKQ